MKVKIIYRDEDRSNFDNEINKFIANKKVIDIKPQFNEGGMSVLIMYEGKVMKRITSASQLANGESYLLKYGLWSGKVNFVEVLPTKAVPGVWTTNEEPNASFTNMSGYVTESDRFKLFNRVTDEGVAIYEECKDGN